MSNLYDRCLRPSLYQLADEVNATLEKIPYAECVLGECWCPHCSAIIYSSYFKKGISKCECGEVYQI